nr:PREDICTED: uncharacterized protein LOC109030052 [Bemisia tabaci]
MFPDSEIAAKFQCRRTKTTAIVRNVIGAASREELNEMLRVKKFALIIDKSTDQGSTMNLSLSVRYFDPKRRDARDRFFDMKEMVKGDAINLYNAIKKSFDENNIPYKSNIVGFAADCTNVMHGRKNSVEALFLIDCPDLFTLSVYLSLLHNLCW